ncbi:globin-3-like [Saccoglossus kowalevskii]|uniref:Globin D, coelomic-like n=1 Tax=Saccoglossus kowalevskii TaxID=10224 RepID=A0ABM0GLE0_SACKO|nr:PREDICTED: globin D, coelomic-like [Saccoglossus kowalevskii]
MHRKAVAILYVVVMAELMSYAVCLPVNGTSDALTFDEFAKIERANLMQYQSAKLAKLEVPNAVTTLTPSEAIAIQSTWLFVYEDKEENGVELFVKLFTEHPDYQALFGYLEGIVGIENIKNVPFLRVHASHVLIYLNTMLESLNDGTILVELLKTLGYTHVGLNLTPEHFDALGPILISLLQEKGGDSFTPFAEKAWLKGWGVMKSVIVGALENGYQLEDGLGY